MHDLLPLVTDALQLAVWLALPTLCVSFAVSLVVGTGQSLTQLTDPALSAIPRALAVALSLSFGATWMASELSDYTTRILRALPEWVR